MPAGFLAARQYTAGRPGLKAMATTGAVVISVTAPDSKVAGDIATRVIREKLAACVQTLPEIESTYWWEGKVETSKEHLLLIKTQQGLLQDLVGQVSQLVTSIHPYEVPEVVATPITGGLPAYIKWLKETTSR